MLPSPLLTILHHHIMVYLVDTLLHKVVPVPGHSRTHVCFMDPDSLNVSYPSRTADMPDLLGCR